MEGGDEEFRAREGEIPVLQARGRTVPEAWERSVLLLWERGARMRTEYDREGDEPSRDATMIIVVEDPMAEPRIHLAFPGGIEDLEKYRQEVLYGVHDHWIKPEEGKWTYTYHQRLCAYAPVEDLSSSTVRSPFRPVNQLEYIVRKLSESPHSRRAQAITWIPTADPSTDDPPCLQRLWCRLVPAGPSPPSSMDDRVKYFLNMNTHWRSRDAYKAAFMNIYALTDLQRWLAEELGRRMGCGVAVGRYVDISDSYHIYGSYFREFSERFLKLVRERAFERRVWRTDDKRVQAAIQAAREQLAAERE
ncbi:MAG: thymidylate synthase [Thermoplasmata archaeon]